MSLSLTKKELRNIYKEKRNALSSDEVIFLSQKIFENFLKTFEISKDSKIHCYISIPLKKEVDTSLFFDYFFKANVRVFVPKIVGDYIISVEVFPDSVYETNNWGVIEPVSNESSKENEFDMCITPLLYCDQHGNRLGYGKGFYDSFFEMAIVKNKIGVNYFEVNEIIADLYKTDVPLDFLLTPFSVKIF